VRVGDAEDGDREEAHGRGQGVVPDATPVVNTASFKVG
jgi:hypothetical protein